MGSYPEANLISISNSQRRPLAAQRLKWIATVYNGVVLDHFSFQPDPGDYLVFLGRISEEKWPDLAVEVARCCGIPLKIAAKVDPAYDQDYHQRFEPFMNDPIVEFLAKWTKRARINCSGARWRSCFPHVGRSPSAWSWWKRWPAECR